MKRGALNGTGEAPRYTVFQGIVSRFVIVPLILLLSGVPAAAVVCDLLLCADPAQAARAASGCHEHPMPASGKRITGPADGCSHTSFADPYVTSGVRRVLHVIVWSSPVEPTSGAALAFSDIADMGRAHGPPRLLRTASVFPLRI